MSVTLAPLTDSLEARWFLPGSVPPEVEAWFESLGPDVPREARIDTYLIPTEGEDLGLKVREGMVQAKQRQARFGVRPLAPAADAEVEAWRKWTLGPSEGQPVAGWVSIAKARRQRVRWAFGDVHARCALELSWMEFRGDHWWSICLEASGESRASRWRAMRACARGWLHNAPALPARNSMGYPAWLRRAAG